MTNGLLQTMATQGEINLGDEPEVTANVQLNQWHSEDALGEDSTDDEDDVVAVTTDDGRFDPLFGPPQMVPTGMLQ